MTQSERPVWEVSFPETRSWIRGATDGDARGQTTEYVVFAEPGPSSVLVRARRRFPPRLRAGEVVRLDPGPEAPVFTVVRVNDCAAYLAPGDWTDYQGRVLEREWSSLLGVSPTAFVFREGSPLHPGGHRGDEYERDDRVK